MFEGDPSNIHASIRGTHSHWLSQYDDLDFIDNSHEEYQRISDQRDQAISGKNWEEITKERYDELLNILPPIKHDYNSFFVRECIVGKVYTFCIKHTDNKYYTASIILKTPKSEIVKSLDDFILNGFISE